MNRVSSSDYIKAKKQNAIYTDVKHNAYKNTTVNPVKKNGLRYNDNIGILLNTNCIVNDCSGGQLNHAKNYDLLYDFNHGKMYNYARCNSTCNTSSNCCSCFTCAFK